MPKDLQKINQRLIDMLSTKKGYFGRVNTWGQKPYKFEPVGFELTEDFEKTLKGMSDEQQKNLITIMTHFEIYARPLKNLLNADDKEGIDLFTEIAWANFMTIIMFGMLEIAVKGKGGIGLDNKKKKIKEFLEKNLSMETKESIAERYSVEPVFKHKKQIKTFSDVIDHLWHHIRCDFIHDAGIESKGLEWGSLVGAGTKDNPITIKRDVPMQELLQMTWQAILNSYGYKGLVQSPRLR